MLKHLMSVMTLSIICLSLAGCIATFPKPDFHEDRCSPYFVKYPDGEINLEKSFCTCHPYEITIERSGETGPNVRLPLDRCHNLVGFSPEAWVGIPIWIQSVRIWYQDQTSKVQNEN